MSLHLLFAKFTSPAAIKIVSSLVSGTLLISSLISCGTHTESSDDTLSSPNQTFDRLTLLENTGVRITVPPQWKTSELLRGDADIYATYPTQDLHVRVVSENNTELTRFGLEDNAEQYRQLIQTALSDYESSTRTDINEVDGDPAIQYEIRGQIEDVPVVYLHTTIQGVDDYYQVVGWTRRERYIDNRETLQAVIASFEGS